MGKYVPQKLPLYAGSAEDKDVQGRRNAGAFKAEGVRFFDQGTIKTHREPTQVLALDEAEFVVAETPNVLLVRDSDGVTRWTESDGQTDPLAEYPGPRVSEVMAFQDGRDVLFSHLHAVDGDLLSVTLGGPNKNALDNQATLRVLSPDSKTTAQISEVNAPGGSYVFRSAASDTTVMAAWEYSDAETSTYSLTFTAWTKSGGTWSATTNSTETYSYPVQNFSFKFMNDNTILGVITTGIGIVSLETFTFTYNLGTGTYTENSLGSDSDYSGYNCFGTHFDGDDLLVYSSGYNTEGHTWTVDNLRVASAATQLTTDDYYGRIKGNVNSNSAQGAQEAQIVPRASGTDYWLIISGSLEYDGADDDDDWSLHASIGSSVFVSTAGWGTFSSSVEHVGSAMLCADSWEDNDTLYMPLVWTAAYTITTSPINRVPFAYGGGALHTPTVTIPGQPPLYGAGLIVTLSGTSHVGGLWGVDEVFGFWYGGYTASQYKYRLRGGSAEFDGVRHIVHPVERTKPASVSQLYKLEAGTATAESTPSGVVAALGGSTCLIDGEEIQQLNLVCPPVVGVYANTNLPGISDPAPDVASWKFCWAWTDHTGVIYRSPPSPASAMPILAEGGKIQVTPPPPVSSLLNAKLYLEIYSDTSGVTQSGIYRLIDRRAIFGGLPQQESFSSFTYTDTAPPLLYTTGGVLANEAPATGDGIVLVQDRLWYLRGNKAFYSQPLEKGTPLHFNGNLFVSAPDGNEIVALSALDEQAVMFTQESIFIVRGNGPTRTGQGQGYVVHGLPTPSGCLSAESVLSTEHGVFFLGHRGLHMVQRNMQVTFIGHPTSETMDSSRVLFSLLDRNHKEAQWWLESGKVVSFHLETGLWSVGTNSFVATGGDFSPTLNRAVLSESGLFLDSTETSAEPGDGFPLGVTYPLEFSTSWLDSNDVPGGFQRVKQVLIQGRGEVYGEFIPATYDAQGVELTAEVFRSTDPYVELRVRVYTDFSVEPSTDRRISLSTEEIDPIDFKVPLDTRKCKTFRVEVSVEPFLGEIMLSGLTALVQAAVTETKGSPNTPGT